MSVKEIKAMGALKGEVQIPGDKSISHRAVMLGSIARGTTEISHFLNGADCLSTIHCFQKMGIEIEQSKDLVLVHGRGLRGLKAPRGILDTGNSGTTTRLICGILSGQDFSSVLSGDDSLNSRPMKRIMDPLNQRARGSPASRIITVRLFASNREHSTGSDMSLPWHLPRLNHLFYWQDCMQTVRSLSPSLSFPGTTRN